MPVDASKHPAHDRRRPPRRDQDAPRDSAYAREIELKRNRGEISCAECRRLKIKCDKQIPCQSCQRRGCAALCPNGSLATGQGTRFVIAATEHLHRRVARMGDRIRQLEDALAVLQAAHSHEPHPLLQQRAPLAAHDLDRADEPALALDADDADGPADVVKAFGTMSISEHGVSRFFGPTGGSEGLLLYDGDDTTASPSSSHRTDSPRTSSSPAPIPIPIPAPAARFSHAFPFTPVGPAAAVLALVRAQLPPWAEARRTAEVYLQNASWLFRSMSRAQLVEELLPAVYGRSASAGESPGDGNANASGDGNENEHANGDESANPNANVNGNGDDYAGPHALALLLYVLAVGRLVDLSLAHTDAEAQGEHWHQLARAALCVQPVLERPSMLTIQALHVGSIYNAMCGSEVSGGESTMETTWSLVALAAHLAQTIGLHRDSARWESSPKIVQRRRMLFWDLFVADSWHVRPPYILSSIFLFPLPSSRLLPLHFPSQPALHHFTAHITDNRAQTLSTGRPPAFSRAYIDCQFPQDDEMTMSPEGDAEPGFGSWGFRFAFECVAEVAATTLTASAPRYAEILALDRKIREFAIPSDAFDRLGAGPGVDPRSVPLAASMTSFVLRHTREVMLLFVHRSYFAQALVEEPTNPLRSPYAPSFLATVRAAQDVLRCVAEQFLIHPAMCSRFWSTWTYAFSAAVVFGVIVTRGPRSHLAASAMGELDRACDLFAQAAKYNRRAAKARTILTRLQDKAHRALAAAQSSDGAQEAAADGAAWDIKQEEIDDELDIFAGRTKILRPAGAAASAANPHNQNAHAHAHSQSHSPASRPDTDMDFVAGPGPSPASAGPSSAGPSSASMQSSFAVRTTPATAEPSLSMTRDWLAQLEQPAYQTQAEFFPQPPPPPLIATSRYGPITSQHPHPQHAHAQMVGRRESFAALGQAYGAPGYDAAGMPPPLPLPPLSTGHHHQHPHQHSHPHQHPHQQHQQHQHQQHQQHAHQQQQQQQQPPHPFAYQQLDPQAQYGYAPPPELAGLGLAPSANLNENWTSLMQRSGILDGAGM
ncbi:hypothetical protein DENSPDRAFT_928581 [Dentipellis sp. KUC8613]|nr:hypothetical protein DENSPDRAFT_928581 [Dentipellis sp. KUC8613]